jgi:hypothetical protein
LAWATLEEVALEAVAEGGRLVARTSARQVAERLGIDPGTASNALRDLRRHGLITLEREHGPAGRFGMSVYVLGPVTGLTVLSPHVAEPGTAQPHIVPVSARPASGSVQPRAVSPEAPASSLQCLGQEALDLECSS